MADVLLGVLALVGGLMLLAAAVLIARDRRQRPSSVPPFLAPMYVLFGSGFVVQGVTGLLGGASSSWSSRIGTLMIVVGGFGAFIVAMVGWRRRRTR